VAILKAQRWGQGQARIEFICGGRIVARLAAAEGALLQASEALKCATHDLPEAAKRTAAESQTRRKTVEALLQELAQHEAARLLAAQPGPVVAKVERGMLMARAVAAALSDHGRIALIASVDEGRAHLCFARPRGDGPAMNALLQEAVVLLSGKGGGSKDFAQGSGDAARLDEALAAARARLQG
jgi:alanyl-tRNA synthetase